MNTNDFIASLITAANAFKTEAYLEKWHKDAVLDDPSVGETFKGHKGIRKYFEDYFIGYSTQTQLIKTDQLASNKIYVEVLFTGTFPGGKVKGMFEFEFLDNKIIHGKADLL